MTDELVIAKPGDIAWSTDDVDLALDGIEVKVLHRDTRADRIDFLVRFPAGYHEPRHTHEGTHVTLVLEGTMVVNDGEHVLTAGDYLFGPADVAHGPFDYPDGCVLFSSFRSGMRHDPVTDGEA